MEKVATRIFNIFTTVTNQIKCALEAIFQSTNLGRTYKFHNVSSETSENFETTIVQIQLTAFYCSQRKERVFEIILLL